MNEVITVCKHASFVILLQADESSLFITVIRRRRRKMYIIYVHVLLSYVEGPPRKPRAGGLD